MSEALYATGVLKVCSTDEQHLITWKLVRNKNSWAPLYT